MKKSILILAAIVISLIGVNAQQSINEKKGKIIIQEKVDHELYISISEDFEEWYKESTEKEMIEDDNNLDLYNSLFDNLELHNTVEKEINNDKENDKLYNSLKEDFEIFNVLSKAEIQF